MSKIPASVLRDFAAAHGLEVGKRGRVSHEVLVAFLRAYPRTTRALARDAGIEVGTRGRLSPSLVEAVAKTL